jgi:hypothetical protein
MGQFTQIDSQPVHSRGHLATRGLLSPSPRFCCPDSELLRRCHGTSPEVDDYRVGITLIAKRHGVNAAMPWRTGTGINSSLANRSNGPLSASLRFGLLRSAYPRPAR